MKIETVRGIESEMKNFLPTLRNLIKVFESNLEIKVLELTFSNISLNTENCVNYSFKRDVERITNVLELCKTMKVRSNCNPILDFVLMEFINTVEGFIMSEDF
jgi:hypothetical protein